MPEDIFEIKGEVVVPYRWSYGVDLTRFFHETRENKQIYGVRCTRCESVLVPPQGICGGCFARVEEEWVPVPDRGELLTYTEVHLPYPGQPTEPPYVYGLIRLDGTSTMYPHMIQGIPHEEMRVGMRVKAVWNPERKGDLYDILYFEPE